MGEATQFVLIIVFLVVYFCPTITACSRNKRNSSAIFVLNLFLGWTLLGWVIALVWAMTIDQEVKHATSQE